ncbi:alpha/beta fold hydrolase [Leucobacter sp. wl10]|uniref:alpha/beta fold hydrolase n=1 Tax=Leucobacter sp. wl10 TaxID=2304677 RepID=UPI000E5BC47C|nr:alpha/beta hydrolase [Leucobacter sp. wl10]RGE19303.1 alpha/beta fold hydrolase [Leucobacter sp. wl10]
MSRSAVRTGLAPVHGAELYYEIRGEGAPLLLIPGASGDAGMYERAAEALAGDFAVITYDRRGNSRSAARGGVGPTSIDEHGDDAAGLISAVGLGPAFVFGNSSGATIAMNLCLRHPEVLRGVVAHEPPKIGTLPNRDEFLQGLKDRMEAAVVRGGYEEAVEDFHGWLVGDDSGVPTPEGLRERVRGNGEQWVRHELGVLDRYDAPQALIEARSTPLLFGVGTTGGTEEHIELLGTYRSSLAELAEQYGAELLDFTGAHVPYETIPEQFGIELRAAIARFA